MTDGFWEDRVGWRARIHVADQIISRMSYGDDGLILIS